MADERTVVLLIDDDVVCAETAKEAFLGGNSGFRLEVADRLADGQARLAKGGVDVVLFSLPMAGPHGEEALENLLRQAAGTPVIALGQVEDPQLGLRLVRMGAQDYLVKGRLTSAALLRCVRHTVERQRHLRRLLASTREQPQLGRVIAFCPVKGGVGATTTVLNVAALLAASGKRLIAAEVLPSWGFTFHLKRRRTTGLTDLPEEGPEALYSRLLQKKLTATPYGFQVLFGAGTGSQRNLAPEKAARLLEASTELAELTLVDLPAQVTETHGGVVGAADYVALVLEPDPLCVDYALVTLKLLEQWGVNPASIGLVVVNRGGLSMALRPRDLKDQLGCEVVGVVVPAGEGCLMALNAGKPLVLLQPESRYAAGIRVLAENLIQQPVRSLTF